MTNQTQRIVIIGGGAAGFFAALSAKKHYPKASVLVLEKSQKLLSKVRVSGGGRCNVTHNCFDLADLLCHYPRGSRFLRQVFQQWSVQDTIEWFEARQVKLKTEADGRMFPTTNSSQTIIDCFLKESQRLGIEIRKQHKVVAILPQENGQILIQIKKEAAILADKVVVATGGSPKATGLAWLETLGHEIESPVPSLFTFNIPENPIQNLQGISWKNAKLKILKTKLQAAGIILITHWGLSGPAVLKLSAWGARALEELGYEFEVQINYLPDYQEQALREKLFDFKTTLAKRQIQNKNPFELPSRLWLFFLEKSKIDPAKRWLDLSKKDINKLLHTLQHDVYVVNGKTTFKEEFVTCGGVSLSQVDAKTMQSKTIPNLYFAGEVLDIDGITGGFNFQSAWATGFLAGQGK